MGYSFASSAFIFHNLWYYVSTALNHSCHNTCTRMWQLTITSHNHMKNFAVLLNWIQTKIPQISFSRNLAGTLTGWSTSLSWNNKTGPAGFPTRIVFIFLSVLIKVFFGYVLIPGFVDGCARQQALYCMGECENLYDFPRVNVVYV